MLSTPGGSDSHFRAKPHILEPNIYWFWQKLRILYPWPRFSEKCCCIDRPPYWTFMKLTFSFWRLANSEIFRKYWELRGCEILPSTICAAGLGADLGGWPRGWPGGLPGGLPAAGLGDCMRSPNQIPIVFFLDNHQWNTPWAQKTTVVVIHSEIPTVFFHRQTLTKVKDSVLMTQICSKSAAGLIDVHVEHSWKLRFPLWSKTTYLGAEHLVILTKI